MDTPGPSKKNQGNYSSDTIVKTLKKQHEDERKFHSYSNKCNNSDKKSKYNNNNDKEKCIISNASSSSSSVCAGAVVREKICKPTMMPRCKDVLGAREEQEEPYVDADTCSSSCCSSSLSSSSSFSSSSSSRYSNTSSHSSYTDTGSSTISEGDETELCSNDQCNHDDHSDITGSISPCSCCEAVSSEQLARENIADGESYDEIEDVFKSLHVTPEKKEGVLDGKNSQPKLTWLKESTFTINGTQAIFYLKLLHDSPHEHPSDSCKISGSNATTTTTAATSATTTGAAAASSSDASQEEPGGASLNLHQEGPENYAAIDSPR